MQHRRMSQKENKNIEKVVLTTGLSIFLQHASIMQ